MNWPFWVGLLLITGGMVTAYRYGLSQGYLEGHSQGYAEGKREGSKDGSRRGYAVGFDRGRRRASESQEEETADSCGRGRLWLGAIGVFLAGCVFLSLASQPRDPAPASHQPSVLRSPPGEGPSIDRPLPAAGQSRSAAGPRIE